MFGKSKKLIVFLSHWYINGLLIPEIYVVRGKTYTFVVEGGDDKVRYFFLNPNQLHKR